MERESAGSASSARKKVRIDHKNLTEKDLRSKEAHRMCLTAILDVIRFILSQGMLIEGHDDSPIFINENMFLDMLKWSKLGNQQVGGVVLQNALENDPLMSLSIQKDMARSCAMETTLAILADLGDRLFSIRVEEAYDCCVKEQMAIFIRYVDKQGQVVERFLGLVHVKETSALCLKEGIDFLFAKYGLSLSRLRGQTYDGVSNMRDKFNGLKSLILKENPSVWYVHCFAHHFPSVIVDICKMNRYTCAFFLHLGTIVNVCGSFCKRVDNIEQLELARKVVHLGDEEITSSTMERPGENQWRSYYLTIVRLKDEWSSALEVLETAFLDGIEYETPTPLRGAFCQMQSYEFVFPMFLMKHLLGLTNTLSMALQEGDQKLLNVINQIRMVKCELQKYRDDGWEGLVDEVNTFCQANDIPIINMEDIVPWFVRVKRDGKTITNYQHYKFEIFTEVIDSILLELSHRFSEASTDLLDGFACLDPNNKFSNFDVEKLAHLPHFYPNDFSYVDRLLIPQELESFLSDIRSDKRFSNVEDFRSLGKKVKETAKDRLFPLVYRLIELALLLPIASASTKRVFSVLKYTKGDLKNKMGDEWLNDSLIVFIEREVFATVDNDVVLKRFKSLDGCRGSLFCNT